HLVATDETAFGVVLRFVADDAGHGGTAIHVHRLLERRVHAAGHVPHIVAADLPGRVGKAVWEHSRGAVEQQPRALDRVARDRHHARLLALHRAALVGIDHARHLAGRVVLDPDRHAVGAHLEIAGGLAPGNFSI